MEYPRYNNYLIFEKSEEDTYTIINAYTEEYWEVTEFYHTFLRSLDGRTDPYTIFEDVSKEVVDGYLKDFEECEFLQDKRKITKVGFGSYLIPLCRPHITNVHRILGNVYNKLLMVSWLPLLICGIYVLQEGKWEVIETDFGFLIGYLLLFLGLMIHEISHAAACVGYHTENQLFEMGLMTSHFMPGAYVMIEYHATKDRFKRAQISAAGIEANLALGGILLMCLKFNLFDTDMLLIGAFLNIFIALANTSMIRGMDIIDEILVYDSDFVLRALLLLADRKHKRMLRRRGINGRATIMASYMILLVQIMLPLFIVVDVLMGVCIVVYG